MDLFMSMEAFVRAAEAQSFANAARQLGVAKSVVTSRVKQLEDHFGVPLFHRSTRAVRLSELGETYYRECVELVNRAHELSGRSRGEPHSLSGTLNIHVLPGFALGHFSQALIEFRETYRQRPRHRSGPGGLRSRAANLSARVEPAGRAAPVPRARRIVRRSRLPEGRTGHRDAARPAASRLRLLFVLPVGRQVAADEGQRYLRNRT
jgi:DNA-binding transcriptional LysR family regulator